MPIVSKTMPKRHTTKQNSLLLGGRASLPANYIIKMAGTEARPPEFDEYLIS